MPVLIVFFGSIFGCAMMLIASYATNWLCVRLGLPDQINLMLTVASVPIAGGTSLVAIISVATAVL